MNSVAEELRGENLKSGVESGEHVLPCPELPAHLLPVQAVEEGDGSVDLFEFGFHPADQEADDPQHVLAVDLQSLLLVH